MTPFILFFFLVTSVLTAPSEESIDNRLKPLSDEDVGDVSPIKMSSAADSSRTSDVWGSSESNQQLTTNSAITSSSDEEDEDQPTETKSSREKKSFSLSSQKKGRKHKALFIDYPFVPQISAIPNFDNLQYDGQLQVEGTEERSPLGGINGGRKRYQESNIYYIRLPPTPYMFVPGLGYVSQPPSYSTAPLRPQISHHIRPQVQQNLYRPSSPHNLYNPQFNDLNPFINLPIDFVSNGKPTGVYQWQSPSYQNSKRPDSQITTLDKTPYYFNGRPHSVYLLRPDARQSVHQGIQYPDYQDTSYY